MQISTLKPPLLKSLEAVALPPQAGASPEHSDRVSNHRVRPVNTPRWSAATDYALLLGSGAGAVASLATQNVTAASLPITALVAFGLLQRRRLERHIQGSDRALQALQEQFATDLDQVHTQITARPTLETVNNLQRATMAHSDRAVIRCSQALEQTQQDIERRLQRIEQPDISHLHQDMAELQDQYTYVCSTLTKLSYQLQRLSDQPRVEATEADVSQIKTELMQLRVNLDNLNSESKIAQATLQDAVRHLDRRLRQVPHNGDPHLIKSEVRELIKAVADLVPRRDFMNLSEKLEAIAAAQEGLRRTVDTLQVRAVEADQNGSANAQPASVQELAAEVQQQAETLQQIESRLDSMAVPFDITAEIRGTTATYLSSLQWQLATLEQATQTLMQQQQVLSETAGSYDRPAWSSLPTPTASETAAPAPATSPVQWLMALQGKDAFTPLDSAVDQALFTALDQVQSRLVLVWPWSNATELPSPLLDRFQEVLNRHCRLDIGWCHPGDRREGQLLHSIRRPWQIVTPQRQQLKTALKQLLPFKQRYPQHFTFKVLGTEEQFLVCDRRYAIVGLRALPAASSVFPSLDLRLRTADIATIDQLLHRFDDPTLAPAEATAFFNRAATRYDLRDPDGAIADYTQVLRHDPHDALALNNRAVVWFDKNQPQRALSDLNQSLQIDPRQFAARCNRGWLHLSQENTTPALTDFEQAMILDKSSPLPYFYHGNARHKMGDKIGAIADFTQAIQRSQQSALLYCHRGATYQQMGDVQRAIADLETAASLLHAQGHHRALAQITQTLNTLKRITIVQPTGIRSV